MSRNHDNPATLRELLLQQKRENDRLRAQATQNALAMQTSANVIQKLQNDRQIAMRALWAFLRFRQHSRATLTLDELNQVPAQAYVHYDMNAPDGILTLQAYDQVPKEVESKALDARRSSLGQLPDAVQVPDEQEPDPQTICPDAWHDDPTGVRCPMCGGKGVRVRA